jgi:hypothetical protein
LVPARSAPFRKLLTGSHDFSKATTSYRKEVVKGYKLFINAIKRQIIKALQKAIPTILLNFVIGVDLHFNRFI